MGKKLYPVDAWNILRDLANRHGFSFSYYPDVGPVDRLPPEGENIDWHEWFKPSGDNWKRGWTQEDEENGMGNPSDEKERVFRGLLGEALEQWMRANNVDRLTIQAPAVQTEYQFRQYGYLWEVEYGYSIVKGVVNEKSRDCVSAGAGAGAVGVCVPVRGSGPCAG